MAGTYKARSVRGKYSQAGYVGEENRPLYIADVPAGSMQDELRDYNRAGYRSERPWNETPYPVFEGAQAMETTAPVVRRKRVRQQSWLDYLTAQAKRERRDVIVCIVLIGVIMLMTAAWGQKMIQGVEIQRGINNYQASTVAFERENERLSQQLELARGGERIRNLAQNELGMLRPERAMTQKIYIQAPDLSAQKALQNSEEPRMEMLDILLGLLNVLHIGE
ncbi:MAG: hypothetical protein E7321_04495 [Clostridiales bacterium]|nr:hypothetical protein [Clostridiales bacterium]